VRCTSAAYAQITVTTTADRDSRAPLRGVNARRRGGEGVTDHAHSTSEEVFSANDKGVFSTAQQACNCSQLGLRRLSIGQNREHKNPLIHRSAPSVVDGIRRCWREPYSPVLRMAVPRFPPLAY